MKVKRVCKECGKEFFVKPSMVKNGRGNYCSKECMGKSYSKLRTGSSNPSWSGGKLKCLCKECGKEFFVQANLVKRGYGIYCSKECMCKSYSKIRGKFHPSWKDGMQLQICERCGKQFMVQKRLIKCGFGRFCSNKCRGDAYRELIYGANNPNWNGGSSFEPYCFKFNEEFRERVRAFFGYVCQKCDHIWKLGEKRLCVHHVNYRKDSCCSEEVNPLFVPVCFGSCHILTNYNRGHWEKYFTDLINDKFGGKCYFTKEEFVVFKGCSESEV